jgi:hypothetical protein
MKLGSPTSTGSFEYQANERKDRKKMNDILIAVAKYFFWD